MKKLNVVLSILVALLLMTACNGDIKSSDTTEPIGTPGPFEDVPTNLYGTYEFPNDITVTIGEGSIVVDGHEVTKSSGVAAYVNGVLSAGLKGLTIAPDTVRYSYTADSVTISFSGLKSDDGKNSGGGTMKFIKDSSLFHYEFFAETILDDFILSDGFGLDVIL